MQFRQLKLKTKPIIMREVYRKEKIIVWISTKLREPKQLTYNEKIDKKKSCLTPLQFFHCARALRGMSANFFRRLCPPAHSPIPFINFIRWNSLIPSGEDSLWLRDYLKSCFAFCLLNRESYSFPLMGRKMLLEGWRGKRTIFSLCLPPPSLSGSSEFSPWNEMGGS